MKRTGKFNFKNGGETEELNGRHLMGYTNGLIGRVSLPFITLLL